MARLTRDFSAQIYSKVLREGRQNTRRAVEFLKAEIKRSINRGNASGHNPSEPGTPPKKVTARLFHSIAGVVLQEGDALVGRVGTNVEYAPRLEFGFHGTDSLGRRYAQSARPFMRPALKRTERDLGYIITGQGPGGRGAGSPGGQGLL